MSTNYNTNEYIVLNVIFAKIDKRAFAFSTGLIFFLSMFTITAILILKGATPDTFIGPNLQSLGKYLPGYNLTWVGNIIGSFYLSIIGAFLGALFAGCWNLVHYLYLAIIINKLHFIKDDWN